MTRLRLAVALPMLAIGFSASLAGQGRRGGGARPDQEPPDLSRSRATSGSSTGTITGTVSARGAKGDTIMAANVLVQLWALDANTSAARDAACAGWLADKTLWMQAKQEVEYPSEMKLSGTPVGNDVALLRTLMTLRRDTVRTDGNGAFSFNKVPFGAYTLEAEAVANDKFVQWTRDVAVIPIRPTSVDLGADTFGENQYCTLAAPAPDTARIYDAIELDRELIPIHPGTIDIATMPSFRAAALPIEIDFVIDEQGVPIEESVRVVTGSVAIADARTYVQGMKYSPPMRHGKPVKARGSIGVRFEKTVRRVN